MVRNPSEMYRQWEEELEELRLKMRDKNLTKEPKQQILNRINKLWQNLGIPGPTYNSTRFCDWINK